MRLGKIACAVVVFALSACGTSAYQKSLHATFLGVKAAQAGFEAWDREQQKSIVERAASYDEGATALSMYRLKREPVIQAFGTFYELLYVATIDDSESKLKAVISAAERLYRLIEQLKGQQTWARRPGEMRIARVRKRGAVPVARVRVDLVPDVVTHAFYRPWQTLWNPGICRAGVMP